MRRLTVAFVLVLLVAAPAAGQSTPRIEGEWLVLVREVFEEGLSEIFILRPDGSELTNLTNGVAADYEPALSPDGTAIAFSSRQPDETKPLFLMDVDGGNRRAITTGYSSSPDWSPDGRSIVFIDSSLDIAVIDADGSNEHKLIETADRELAPRWSPDGTKIVYYVDNATGTSEVFVLAVADLTVTQLTFDPAGDSEPDWSPDGTTIAWVSFRDGGGNNIHAMNSDGSDQRVLVASGSNDFTPGWSPDGTRVVFEAVRDEGFAIVVFDLATGTGADILTSVVGEPRFREPSWIGVVIDPTVPVTTTVPGATTTVPGATTTVPGATTTVAGATTTLVAGSEGEATESSDGLLIGLLIAALVVSAFLGGILFTKRSGALGQPPPPPPPVS